MSILSTRNLESVYIDRLVRKGFDDPCLYVQEELNKIDPNIINNIGENGGQAPDEKRKDAKETIDLSHMTEEQRAAWEEKIRQKKAEAADRAKRKPKRMKSSKNNGSLGQKNSAKNGCARKQKE